ncbi:hypothetical protein BRC70_09080 [Halobacteriales archaeon QH_6_68_27]|nr:MAG: hypothetical protein BRC70_09080 [Halobacteriales archaeon QH_6_68_27]
MQESDRRLLELVRGRAGDAFRGAVRYDADEFTVLYVRDDIGTEELRAALPTIVERARADEPVVPVDIYGALGETQATVELQENAALVHFRRDTGGRGLLISLDRDVAQGLGSFIEKCLSVLDEESG